MNQEYFSTCDNENFSFLLLVEPYFVKVVIKIVKYLFDFITGRFHNYDGWWPFCYLNRTKYKSNELSKHALTEPA